MMWNPLWFLIVPAIIWPLFIMYAKPIFALQEVKTIENLILFSGAMSLLLSSTILPPLFWIGWKQDLKRKELIDKMDRDTNPKYAKRLRHYDITPTKGTAVVVVNEDLWIVVKWDKTENSLKITVPPSHENRAQITSTWFNGKIEEVQKVDTEDLPRIS